MNYTFMRFPNGKYKAATFSYDDGSREDIRVAGIFDKYGMKGTFNIVSSLLDDTDGEGFLTANEIKKYLLSKGHEVAVHGDVHKALGLCRPFEGIKDVLDCRVKLEQELGIIIRGLAYADCGISRLEHSSSNSIKEIERDVKRLGLCYARALISETTDKFPLPSDFYAWLPTAHHTNPDILKIAEKFSEFKISDDTYCSSRQSILFYLWGHSFEFSRDNNFDLLDDICKILAEKQDTWFATNIEIYDYISAYESLYFSADGKSVYNPTATKIWFEYNNKLFSVKSKETLKFA